jgi:hypothetical protein
VPITSEHQQRGACAISGERRLHRTNVGQDVPMLFLMFGFVVLVVFTKFPLSGWTPIDLFGQ